jgi:tetratricopeptide (TPR) repeat protein
MCLLKIDVFDCTKNNHFYPYNNILDFVLSVFPKIMAQKQKIAAKVPVKGKTPPRAKIPVKEGFFSRNSFSIALFLITFIVFGNGIFNEYALDDEFYTNGGNKLTQKGMKGIPEIFTTHTFYNNDGSGYSYRPVAVASFAVENQFFGEQPHVSHFINVLLYGLIMVLLFRLLRKWFVTQGDWFSFFVCLLFLVHPLHTEVVDNIKCRDELLAMLFTLCSIHVLWKFRELDEQESLLRKGFFVIGYTILFLTAELSKTTVLPFYLLIPLALYFFTNDGWKKIVLYMLPLIAVGLLTKFLISHGLPPQSRTYKDFENPLWGHVDFMKHIATSFYIVGRYLFLHFIPYPLVYYYGYKYVDIVSWSNPIAIVSLLIHIALGILALRELKKKSILGFGLLFYLINIAIFSNLLKPAPGLMAERFVFAASLGFCIVVVWAIFHFMKKNVVGFRWKNPDYVKPKYILLGLVFIYSIMSFSRNMDWADKETLYGHDMEYLSESAKANMLYAALLSKNAMQANLESRMSDGKGGVVTDQQKAAKANDLFLQSRIYYRQATEIAPYYHTAWSNLGTTYFFTGATKEALPYFLRGVKENPNYAEGWYNVGMAYKKLGNKDSATIAFSLCIKSDSTYVPGYDELSHIIMENGDPQGALTLMQKAARNKPDSEGPWNTISSIYMQLRTSADTARAAAAQEMAAQKNPSNYQRLYRLAEYFRIHGDMAKYNQYVSMGQEQQRIQEKKQKSQQGQPQQMR